MASCWGAFLAFVVLIQPFGRDSCRFEQSFSDDSGRTWELNWVATDVRVKG